MIRRELARTRADTAIVKSGPCNDHVACRFSGTPVAPHPLSKPSPHAQERRQSRVTFLVRLTLARLASLDLQTLPGPFNHFIPDLETARPRGVTVCVDWPYSREVA